MRAFFLSTAVLCALVLSSRAAEPETPESVATQQLAALQKQDWKGFTATMHSRALQRFKESMAVLFEDAPKNSPRGQAAIAFFGSESSEELQRLEPAEFVSRFMANLVKVSPEAGATLTRAKSQVLGHVAEGESKAHVVVRTISDGELQPRVEVISMEKDGEVWRALLKPDFESMIAGVAEGLNAAEAQEK
jgi:hypothetical protein